RAAKPHRPLFVPGTSAVRSFFLSVLIAASALAGDPRLDEARQALQDGLPQVAIYKLRQISGRKLAKEDQAVAELLLAQALFAAGRFDETAMVLEKWGASSQGAKF